MSKISIYRKKLTKKKELEFKQDLIVPDVKQDIFKILDANFYCYFSKVEISNGFITVSGNVDSYISYISSSEETLGLQTTFNIDDKLENNIINDNMNLQYNIEVLKQDIKIINERKISIFISLEIQYDIYGVDEIEIFNDFDKVEELQINSKKININSLVGGNCNLANLKEEIKIENTDIISDILKVDTDIANKEVKISYNKVLTKADLKVCIIYLTKDGRVGKAEEQFPLMAFIDIDNIKEENSCSTDYQVRNILLNVNNGNENSITIQMEYEIICKAFEKIEQEVVSDLYSLKYDTEFTSKDIEINNELSTNEWEKVDINEKINIENVKRIVDVFGNSRIIQNNEGELDLKIYYEVENKIGLNVQMVKIPFICKKNYSQVVTRVEKIEYELNDDNMILITGSIINEEQNIQNHVISVVQDITKKELVDKNNYGIIVYSVKKNDSLWDISKKFKVTQESIINCNNLEEPYELKNGEKMYIVK